MSDGLCINTGPHYNPREKEFDDGNEGGYVGNLGTIEADADGRAVIDVTFKNLDLRGQQSVLGRSFVIHGLAENGGKRGACGTVALLNPDL